MCRASSGKSGATPMFASALDPIIAVRNLNEKWAWYVYTWSDQCRHAVSENRNFGAGKYYEKPGSDNNGGSPSVFQVCIGTSDIVEYVADGVVRYTSSQAPWAGGDTLYVSASWEFTYKPYDLQWVSATGVTIGPVWT